MTTKNPEEIQERLKVQGVESHISRGRNDDPLPWVVAGNLDGIPFDIIPQVAGAQVANGIFVEPIGIRILDIADLIAVKCYAGTPKDILDVANLIRTRPDMREKTHRIAEKYGHGKMLEIFLSDRPHVSTHFPEG